MRYSLPARAHLDAELERLEREHLVVLELDALDDLVCDPDPDPFASRRGPGGAGVDHLGAMLATARRLPEELTVRVVVPAGAPTPHPVPEVEAALRRRAERTSSEVWREAMAERAMGLRQFPAGMAIATITWALAYVLGYLATTVEGAGFGLLAVSTVVSITVAWVTSWWVVETAMLAWRLGARRAAAYDLIAGCRLEVVTEGAA